MHRSKLFARALRCFFAGLLLLTLAGCFGVVGAGYYGPGYWGGYGPDVYVFGGYHQDHHWDRAFAARGAASRGWGRH